MDLLNESTGDKIGSLAMGDSIGEEAILEQKSAQKEMRRYETALSRNETFLFEIKNTKWVEMRDQLTVNNLELDLFTLNNYLKRQSVQKRSWRLYK